MACNEACQNAIEHGYELGADLFDVVLERDGGGGRRSPSATTAAGTTTTSPDRGRGLRAHARAHGRRRGRRRRAGSTVVLRRRLARAEPRRAVAGAAASACTGARGACAREVRQDLARVEVDEAVVVGADLADVDLVEAGVDDLLDRGDVLVGIGAAGERVGDLLLGDERRRLLEVARRGQHLRELALERLVGPQPVRRAHALVAVRAPADLQAARRSGRVPPCSR